MLRLYVIGLCILIGAILANVLAVTLGIKTWYDLLELLNKQGLSGFKDLKVYDAIWLFLVYPMLLGLSYLLGNKLYLWISNG